MVKVTEHQFLYKPLLGPSRVRPNIEMRKVFPNPLRRRVLSLLGRSVSPLSCFVPLGNRRQTEARCVLLGDWMTNEEAGECGALKSEV